MKICDLHTHSSCSDGSQSPKELVRVASEAGLSAVALCDHNTVEGLPQFVSAAKESGTEAVCGVEVTCGYKGKEVHMLGLFLPSNSWQRVQEYLMEINVRKVEGNKELCKNLNAAGYDIDYTRVLSIADGAIPNRVHFAKALIERGYIDTISNAFGDILSEEKGYYRSAEKLDAFETVEFLASVGAVPVMAHPLLNLTLDELKVFLPKAKECGLVGIECIYSLFSDEETKILKELADAYDLCISGGSDYHGENKPDIQIGKGKGSLVIPAELYYALKSKSKE